MKTWNCEVGLLSPAGGASDAKSETGAPPTDLASELKGLTVGQSFRLLCRGDETKLNQSQLRIETPGADLKTAHRFQLKLLSVTNLRAGEIDAVVTSLEVGDHAGADVVLTDGTETISLAGARWSVQSILPKVAELQKKARDEKTSDAAESSAPDQVTADQAGPGAAASQVQPYGFTMPLPLGWSWGLVAPLLAAILILVLLVIQIARRRLRDRNLMREVATMKSARRPLDELLSVVRAMDRKLDFNQDQTKAAGEELRRQFDIFLVRTFLIPAHAWSVPRTIAGLRGLKVSEATATQTRRLMLELRALASRPEAIPSRDVQQIVQLIRKVADLIVAERDRAPTAGAKGRPS